MNWLGEKGSRMKKEELVDWEYWKVHGTLKNSIKKRKNTSLQSIYKCACLNLLDIISLELGLEALTRMVFFLSMQWSSLVSVKRVRPGNEIKWKWWMFFFQRKEKTLVVIILSIIHYLHSLGPLDFFVQKVWTFVLCKDFLGEISKPPTNKDLAFVEVPFSIVLQWHLRRHF